MTKAEAIERLIKYLAPNAGPEEKRRLAGHHNRRSHDDVMESLERWEAIEATTDAECRKHCQLAGLPRVGR